MIPSIPKVAYSSTIVMTSDLFTLMYLQNEVNKFL